MRKDSLLGLVKGPHCVIDALDDVAHTSVEFDTAAMVQDRQGAESVTPVPLAHCCSISVHAQPCVAHELLLEGEEVVDAVATWLVPRNIRREEDRGSCCHSQANDEVGRCSHGMVLSRVEEVVIEAGLGRESLACQKQRGFGSGERTYSAMPTSGPAPPTTAR